MKDIKTFNTYLVEQQLTETDMQLLQEGLQSEWTTELEDKVDLALEQFVQQYQNEDGTFELDRLEEAFLNEGLLGSIFGGLAGFALGKSVGKVICKVLGIQKGIFYDLLTSRLVGAALGAAMGKRI
jgi:hypothetical protein|tara:strand:- start:568 stop:945 length:378 start_codon:yes stop_codon:yes gene_type:complete